ncbi:McrC family protein [Paenibacillus chitinolyticus]|uniref:McrC family protein n=1 Tax=Paenibacillus chitinolyticus TaxID=79263 RepID=UPI001C4972E1|nr:McrC family protein [Paenibacillus chitinolyticus]MBV6717336.1 McrC family protein [Paenibacillus chitinolyticus]
MNRVKYTIKEYDSFTKNPNITTATYHFLPEPVFDQLEQFVLSNRQESATGTEAIELMTVTSKRGIGKVISARNYVGLITMSNGTEIEILPKIYSRIDESSAAETKRVFLHMLRSLKEMPFKHLNFSNLNLEKHTILEIFIRMFIEEAYMLVKRGLKSAYTDHQDNECFYKGKLNFSRHIVLNAAHKERFYIEYEIFNLNRPENRLIKTTIELLRKVCSSRKSQKNLHTLLAAFEAVDLSSDHSLDFTKVTSDRNMSEYGKILQWCKVFLNRNSFTPFKGSGVAYALLFPMEKVFENYVAGQLRGALSYPGIFLKTQDRLHHLYDNPRRFSLRPDIVVNSGECTVVLDTKWKLLLPSKDYGISPGDMYQAYAYHKKYNARTVILVYPWTTAMSQIAAPIIYRSNDGVTVQIYCIDLTEGGGSIGNLGSLIEEIGV